MHVEVHTPLHQDDYSDTAKNDFQWTARDDLPV